MKLVITSMFAFLLFGALNAQEDPDTTRLKLGGKEVIIVSPKGSDVKIIEGDTINAEPSKLTGQVLNLVLPCCSIVP